MPKIISKIKVVVIVVFLIAAAIMISYGLIYQLKPEGVSWTLSDFTDAFIESAIGGDYLLLTDAPKEDMWLLGIGKILFKIAIVLIGLSGLDYFFNQHLTVFSFQLKSWFFRNKNNQHVLILGVGDRGTALALKHIDAGKKVVGIEIDQQNQNIAELRNKGAVIIVGDAMDNKIINRLRPRRAQKIYVVCTSDSANMVITKNLLTSKSASPNTDIVTAIESSEMRMFFRNRFTKDLKEKKVDLLPRLIGFRYQAALNIIKEQSKKLALKTQVKEKGVHALIHASDDVRQDLIRAAVVMLQISGHKTPSLCVSGSDEKDAQQFNNYFPAAPIAVNLNWNSLMAKDAVTQLGWEQADLALFALDNDPQTLAQAERFTKDFPNSIVIACLRDSGELIQLLKGSEQKDSRLHIKSLYGLLEKNHNWHDDSIENDAIHINDTYYNNAIKNGKAEGKTIEEIKKKNSNLALWEDLPEHLRDSNRLAAQHNQIKKEICKINPFNMDEKTLVDYLSRTEKFRWNAEKAMDGWRAPINDKERKQIEAMKDGRNYDQLIHPSLVSYDELTKKDQHKDEAIVQIVREVLGKT